LATTESVSQPERDPTRGPAARGLAPLRARPRRLWLLRCIPFFVLCAAIAMCTAQVLIRRGDRAWNQDESVSFLESTCHLSEFNALMAARKPPYGAWVDAGVWRRLVESEGDLCFGRVARDLATLDVHPPLYFWALHVWVLVFGNVFDHAIGINLLLMALACLAIYQLGKTLFASRLDAAALTFVASLSPVAAYATLEFRPYALLGLSAALYGWALVCCVEPARRPRLRNDIALGAATALGMLTHYLFVFVLLAAGLYALARLAARPRRLLRVGASTAAGLVFAALSFPIVAQIGGHQKYITPDNERLALRMQRIAVAFDQLLPHIRTRHVLTACGVFAAAWLAMRFGRGARLPRVRFERTRGLYFLVAALATPGVMAWQYSLGLSPTHAMTPKYLAAMWPLVGLYAAGLWRLTGRRRWATAIAVCALCALPNLEQIRAHRQSLDAKQRSLHTPAVIIDNTNRLQLPRLLARIEPGTRVLLAEQSVLLDAALVLPKDFLYLSCAKDSAARKRAAQLAERFDETHDKRRTSRWGPCWIARRYVRKH
jgi:hypothetical protein